MVTQFQTVHHEMGPSLSSDSLRNFPELCLFTFQLEFLKTNKQKIFWVKSLSFLLYFVHCCLHDSDSDQPFFKIASIFFYDNQLNRALLACFNKIKFTLKLSSLFIGTLFGSSTFVFDTRHQDLLLNSLHVTFF